MFPEGTVPPGIALALECTMHSCKKQFLRASSIEQFRTTKSRKLQPSAYANCSPDTSRALTIRSVVCTGTAPESRGWGPG